MKASSVLILFLFTSSNYFAQHDEHAARKHGDTLKHTMEDSIHMHSFFSPNLLMNRDGSGTSWQPDDSPLYMHMIKRRKTSFMFNGSLFVRYNVQDITNQSNRGGQQFDAPNMFMLMVAHKLNDKNLLSLLTMFSLDPLTVGNSGYPLLFQTGESYQGVPLVDRQHPHDLFAQLAVNYTHSFTKDIDVNALFGYPAEPALGPVVFMHRLSAMNNPDAPLGHHWQDATHISFGVGTLGLRYKNIKAEGSIFTGREPDEFRYDFEPLKFDSYSYRLTINPNKHLSVQFSQGYIKSPEELFPDEDVIRTSGSMIHTKRFTKSNFVSSSIIWGMNNISNESKTNSILLESNWQFKPLAIYSRLEFLQKDAHELQLHQFDEHTIFNITAFTLGVSKHLLVTDFIYVNLGAQGTFHFTDKNLQQIYGIMPLSGQVYMRFFPPPMQDKLHSTKCESMKNHGM